MAGGRASRGKGSRGEREIVKLMGGERVPLSGAAGGSFSGDVINIPYIGVAEVKRRRDGFRQLYSWLGENDALFLRADRREWLVCIRAKDLRLLLDEMDELKLHALQQGQAQP